MDKESLKKLETSIDELIFLISSIEGVLRDISRVLSSNPNKGMGA